jgi:hypothetical protein
LLQHETGVTDENVQKLIAEGDFDKDDGLSFREFVFLCQRAEMNKSLHILPVENSDNSENNAADIPTKIREVFKALFDCIGVSVIPSIQQSVQYFEKKVQGMLIFIETSITFCTITVFETFPDSGECQFYNAVSSSISESQVVYKRF